MKKTKPKGITLIALVVTIVVLLILAGVTITVLWGDHGILKTAGDATDKFGEEAEREKIENVRIDWWTKKVTGENVTVEDFFTMLKEAGIIEKREDDVTGSGDNNAYIVETNSGYTVEVIVDENGNIQIGEIVKGNLVPKIRDIKISTTENSITAKATVARAEGKTVIYEYKLETEVDSSYKPMTVAEGGSYTATGLTKDARYKIRVTITPTDPLVEDTRIAVAQEQESDWAYLGRVAKSIATRTDIDIDNTTERVSGKTELNEDYDISVGDTFTVRYNGEDYPGLRTVRVLGFKHDDLADQTVYRDNEQDTRIWEKAGITFDFVDFLTDKTWKRMNENNDNTNGWAATEMREYLNGYNSNTTDTGKIGVLGGEAAKLSNASQIKQVKKEYLPNYNSDILSETKTEDYLWLLSCGEIWNDGNESAGTKARGYARNSEGSQYAYYKEVTNGIAWNSANTELVKKAKSNVSASYWWLRSPYFYNSTLFCGVNSAGYCGDNGASSASGVAPGFSI